MKKKVRVAVVGVGNCASSLIQGVEYYRAATANSLPPGVMHADIGGYAIDDIEFSAAFDVSEAKVGLDLAEAIGARPNDTAVFAEVPASGVTVEAGPALDGIGPHAEKVIKITRAPPVDVAARLKQTETDVVVSYLPVGSQQASEYYAEQALNARCAYVNCIPVFLASEEKWRGRFAAANLPLIGDDIKSQVGATIVHRSLVDLFRDRGVRVDRTYQLNFGGNMDFLNMLDAERLSSKKISKTRAVNSRMTAPLSSEDIHVGPSDHVPWLGDRKWCYIRLEGTAFGGVPLNCELKLEVWDSPNSAGVVIDAVRCAKLALDRSVGGALVGASGYFMKSPPVEFADTEARRRLEHFISGADELAS